MFVLKRILQRSFSVSKGVNLSKGLRKLLKEELVHEKTTHFQDKSIEDSLKELEYSLIEKNESNIIELRKELDDYLFIINVEARKPEKLDLEEETQIEKDDKENFCCFTVFLVDKEKKYKALAFECFCIDAEIHIDYVELVKDFQLHKGMSRFDKVKQKKFGKKFDRLSEPTKDSFIKLLRHFGLSTDVAIVIEHLSLVKEQSLYEKWLFDLIEVLKKIK